jgi:gamma-glutamyltranspeptidase / glutathione hydrolase
MDSQPRPPPVFEYISRRSPVLGQKACVASSQPLATVIGTRILQAGGNAIDASVAVAAALAVTEPCSTGIGKYHLHKRTISELMFLTSAAISMCHILGGDCFLLYYEKKTAEVHGLNGSGRCAGALTLEKARKDTGSSPSQSLPHSHGHTVTVSIHEI